MKSDQAIGGLFTATGSPYRVTFELKGDVLHPTQLLDVIDLSRPSFHKIAQLHEVGDENAALEELLQYFRQRNTVAWSAWCAEQSGVTTPSLSGLAALQATDDDKRVAENAAQHIFQPYNAFPPTKYTDPLNWDYDPHGNIEWAAHMHRMSGWDLSTTRCYSTTQDERYAKLWVDLTDDWIERNPLTRERCFFPQSWDAIQVGIRSTRWSGLLPYYLHSSACTPQFLARFLTAIYNHARRTLVLPYPNNDNFYIIETAGLADIALAFPEFNDAEEWRITAFDRLQQAMREQVMPDGMHGELSPTYHLYCASLFLNVADTAIRNGYQAPFLGGVESMMEVLMGISTPQGLLPVVGDASPSDVRPLLAKAARIFNRDDFLAVASGGMQGVYPTKRNTAMRSSGFYTFRSDWSADGTWMCMHCGPASIQPSAFHSQYDNGTFELMAHGEYLMRDPGVYCYAIGDPRREAFRRTATHQTLTLDGANSHRAGRLLQWVNDDGYGNANVTVENQSYPELLHRRTVFFVSQRYFVLVDEAIGTAIGKVELHFQFSPGELVIDKTSHIAYTQYRHGVKVLVWQPSDAPVQIHEETAWYSAQHNIKVPMPGICSEHKRKTLPVRFLTVLVPWRGSHLPEVTAQLIGQPGEGAISIRLRVDDEQFILQRTLLTTSAS